MYNIYNIKDNTNTYVCYMLLFVCILLHLYVNKYIKCWKYPEILPILMIQT